MHYLRIYSKQDTPFNILLCASNYCYGSSNRANAAKGVNWLGEAVDSALLQVANNATV